MTRLREYFNTDFVRYMEFNVKLNADICCKNGLKLQTEELFHKSAYDLESNSKFIAIYVPESMHPFVVALELMKDLEAFFGQVETIEKMPLTMPEGSIMRISLGQKKEIKVEMKIPGQRQRHSSDNLIFTGRIYIYHEMPVSESAEKEFTRRCQARGLSVMMRSSKYAQEKDQNMHPLAFISHDSRDKKSVAEPLARELMRRGCKAGLFSSVILAGHGQGDGRG